MEKMRHLFDRLGMQNPLKSVGMKLFIPVFLCIVVLVGGLGLLSYQKANAIIESKMATATGQTILQTSDKLSLMRGTFEDLTMQIITDNDLAIQLGIYKQAGENTYDHLSASQAIIKKLEVFTNLKDGILAVEILPLTGGGMISTSSATVPADWQNQPWAKAMIAAEGSPVWFGSQDKGMFGNLAEPAFAVGRLIKNITTGSKDYVVLFEIRKKQFDDVLDTVKLGDSGKTVLLGPDNKIIANSGGVDWKASFPVQLTADMIKRSADHAQTEQVKLNGSKNLVVYKTINGSDWATVATVPIAELTKETSQIRSMTLLLILIGILVAIAVGFLLARLVGGPLGRMRTLMQQGAQGDLTVRMTHHSQDEIGQLGASFNVMMEQITVLVRQTNESAVQVLDMAAELLQASRQTATSAREIATATEEIANGASSLAVEAEKGNSLTQQIGEQMQLVVESNREMGETAAAMRTASEQGTAYMSELASKTNTTEDMTRSMVEKVDRLKESTSSIRRILEVLDNMTKQTNILSLNATIEAARAGAAGKGFMVVADEIRKLADQSKLNIGEVGLITETIQEEIDQTVSVLSTAYPVFQEQIRSVKETELIFQKVQGSMGGFIRQLNEARESIQGLEHAQEVLGEAMSNVSAVSEQSSATSQEVASLSSEQLSVSGGLVRLSETLEELSRSLQSSLQKFKV